MNSHRTGRKDGFFIPPHGGYRNLLSYRKAEIIYDATVRFCERFIDRYDRTRDQMIQAARCGKQNLIEDSIASGTSKKIELNLTGIARASLGELLGDYEDFLRVRTLVLWDKNSRQARTIRNLGSGKQIPHESSESYETYRSYRDELTGNSGQHHNLSDSSGQLPDRPADSSAGKGLSV